MCCQSEIRCPCVLKPAEERYHPSAKPVIPVTRLPGANPLVQPAFDWPVRPSSSVQRRSLRLILIVCNIVFYALLCLCPRNALLALLLWWLWRSAFECSCQRARTLFCVWESERKRETVIYCVSVMNDNSLTMRNTTQGLHNSCGHCVKVSLYCTEDFKVPLCHSWSLSGFIGTTVLISQSLSVFLVKQAWCCSRCVVSGGCVSDGLNGYMVLWCKKGHS